MAEERITWRRRRFNKRTRDMLLWVEGQLGTELTITQGSYNTSVAASGGTHAGGGAVDLWASNVAPETVVLHMRRAGFAAWWRRPYQGPWGNHVHGIAAGDDDLSSAAAKQVVAYRNGRNGLANNGPDDGAPGFRLMTWELRQQLDKLNENTNNEGNDVTEEQFNALANLIRQAIRQAVSDTTIDVAQTKLIQDQQAFLVNLRRELGIQFEADAARDVAEAKAIDELEKKVDALPKS